jgi:hypothetical protein
MVDPSLEMTDEDAIYIQACVERKKRFHSLLTLFPGRFCKSMVLGEKTGYNV